MTAEARALRLNWDRQLMIVAAVVVALAMPAVCAATCNDVAVLLGQGASVSQINRLTGLTPGQIRACSGVQQPYVRSPVGPPPHGAAGPAPHGAPGPPPLGAAGPAPHGAAGPAPLGAAGPPPHGAAGPAPFGTQ